MARDVETDVTVLIKTFERPDCLRRLVASIRRFYPRIPILVVDDSAVPLDPVPDGITRYVPLAFNSVGLAEGRNVGLRHVKTPYVLISDDDMVFGRRTDLRKMLHVLETTRFDIVSCRWMDHDPWRSVCLGYKRTEGGAEIVDGAYVRRLDTPSGTMDGLPVFDLVHNFFMASPARLGEDPWDARLKLLEHNEFFLRIKERGLLCTRLPDVVVDHYPRLPPDYYDLRRGTSRYLDLWYEERGIERRVVIGRWYTRRDRLVHYYPSLAAYGVRRTLGLARRALPQRRATEAAAAENPSS